MRRYRSTFARLLAATAMASAIATVSVVADPASADAATTKKYLETNCVIKAFTGSGLKGHGCDLWGTPHWVEVGQRGHPLPGEVTEAVMSCLTHGAFDLVESIPEGGPAELPPPWDVIAGVAYFSAGCVQGVTEATVKLGKK